MVPARWLQRREVILRSDAVLETELYPFAKHSSQNATWPITTSFGRALRGREFLPALETLSVIGTRTGIPGPAGNLSYEGVCIRLMFWVSAEFCRLQIMESKPVSGTEFSKPVVWKLLLGALLIFIKVKNFVSPTPNLLKTDTPAEQMGMNITYFVMVGLGCWFLYSGAKPLWHKAAKQPRSPINPI
jgi:hypothetical protein